MFLNDQQNQAVHLPLGTALVLAGAGTGKTAIISKRIAYLVQHCHIRPEEIVALTFTNNAAKELRNRIEHQHGIFGCWIGTFHRLGHTILTRELPSKFITQNGNFSIYDDEDRKIILKKAIALLDNDLSIDIASEWIHALKNNGINPDENEGGSSELSSLFFIYEKLLAESNALDLDDLLAKTKKLLENDTEILNRYQKKWCYFLLDEYQDTNRIQDNLIKLLSGPAYNNFFVGDPDQAIYSWRGATIDNILNIPKLYSNTQTILLEKNYRSTNTILGAANALIKNNEYRFQKDLWSDLGTGDPILIYAGISDIDEAEYVARMVRKSADKDSKSIAILYRSHNISRTIEDALLRHKIPYAVLGGISFYLRKEIKDALALLKMTINPDPIALKRVLDILPGIGEKTKGKILSHGPYFSTKKAITKYLEEQSVTSKQKQSLQSLINLLDSIENTSAVLQKIEKAIHSKIIQESIKDRSHDRLQNLSELFSKSVLWKAENPQGDLQDFISMISLNAGTANSEEHVIPWVKMMTIHYAKGLEFDEVFLVGLEDGVFPKNASENSQKEQEEERRLCYVAITRAKRKLYISYSKRRMIWGSLRRHGPSLFLDEIPEEFIYTIESSIKSSLGY